MGLFGSDTAQEEEAQTFGGWNGPSSTTETTSRTGWFSGSGGEAESNPGWFSGGGGGETSTVQAMKDKVFGKAEEDKTTVLPRSALLIGAADWRWQFEKLEEEMQECCPTLTYTQVPAAAC